MRGATFHPGNICQSLTYFNPRTPYGVRPRISRARRQKSQPFQSTHPIRGATAGGPTIYEDLIISIHAPHTGCDACGRTYDFDGVNFNPRTPYGVRLANSSKRPTSQIDFNPRTPYGVRPALCSVWRSMQYFNPRTPYGVRLPLVKCRLCPLNFNPRTPYGVRQQICTKTRMNFVQTIQI